MYTKRDWICFTSHVTMLLQAYCYGFSDLLNSEMMAVKLLLTNHMWEDAIQLVEKNQQKVRGWGGGGGEGALFSFYFSGFIGEPGIMLSV